MLASVIISHNSNMHCTRIQEICLLNVQPCSNVPIKNFHARIFHSMSPGFFFGFLCHQRIILQEIWQENMIFMQISTFSPDKNMPEPAYSEGQTPTTWQFRLQQASVITRTGFITSCCNPMIVLDRAYEDDDDNNNILSLIIWLYIWQFLLTFSKEI